QLELALESQKTDAELDELQKRWNQLVHKIFERDSYFPLESGEREEIETTGKNADMAVAYLKAQPDVDSFLKVAFVRNLRLQSVKKELEAKLESYSQVTQLEDVLSQFSSFVKDLNTLAGPMQHQVSIKQSYPFPGALSLKANIAEQEVRIVKEKYEIALRDMVTQFEEAFYEWAFFAQAIGIMEGHLRLLGELEAVASVHFRTGKGGFNDVIKAQIRISKLKDDLINLKEGKGVVEAKMAQYLNLAAKFSFAPPASIPVYPLQVSVEDLYDIALKNQQELKLLFEEIKKSRLSIELAEKKYYPDLTPGFSYFEDRKGSRVGAVKAQENFATKPETQPLYWFGENDAYIREAKLLHQALLKKLENHKEELLYQTKKFSFQLDKAQRAKVLYESSLLPLAQKALEVSVAEYKTGKTDFLSLLDAQTTLLNFGIDYQKSLKDHGQHKARLEKLIGKRLSRLEIKNESAH
ncbi:MAG: TolC family protein, partial [Nitrospinales bacterium]